MQDLPFLSHTSNFIDDEEFLVLSDFFEWKNPCFLYEDYSPFNLDEMTESECLSEFRFRKRDIPILADVLDIPETMRCEQGSTFDGLEGLCMVLRRLYDSQVYESRPSYKYVDERCAGHFIRYPKS